MRIEKLMRDYGRGALLSALEQRKLLTRIVIGASGAFKLELRTWAEYWGHVLTCGSPEMQERLEGLKAAWGEYVDSGFGVALQQPYCHAYFSLLNALLKEVSVRPTCAGLQAALSRTLAFECFAVTSTYAKDCELAAATSTLRNPCYLLTKLKWSKAIDDPEFLPVITVPARGAPSLFYHYRQHKLSVDSQNAILVYVCARQRMRRRSFQAINAFEAVLGSGADPRASERASRLVPQIIAPYVRQRQVAPDGTPATSGDVELLDLGAGSGALVAGVCRDLRSTFTEQQGRPAFKVWALDFSPTRLGRFFGRRDLRHLSDCLTVEKADYREWLSRNNPLPPVCGVRIALVSRLLNNLSDFTIHSVAPEKLPWELNGTEGNWKSCLPSRCLADGKTGASALQVSASRVWIGPRRTFKQPSLSQFYRGLHALLRQYDPSSLSHILSDRVFLPLRSFRRSTLRARDGSSIIGRLNICSDLTVIVDADLRPADLRSHVAEEGLSDIAVISTFTSVRL